MNLHGIVAGNISAVNPRITGQYKESLGLTTFDDGKRTPKYAPPKRISLQIQPLSTSDIMKLDSLNLQGVLRKIYLDGSVDAIVRSKIKGGDLFILDCGGVNDGVWLVNEVMEQWPDWCCIVVTLQNGS